MREVRMGGGRGGEEMGLGVYLGGVVIGEWEERGG